MIPQSKPSYPALEQAAKDDRVISFENNKGFLFLFAALVLAAVCGMVFFIHFVSQELPVKENAVSETQGKVRALFLGYRQNNAVEAAPYYYQSRYEKNSYKTTSYK